MKFIVKVVESSFHLIEVDADNEEAAKNIALDRFGEVDYVDEPYDISSDIESVVPA